MNERDKELALQAGYSKDFLAIGFPNNMEKFADLIRADEREACAKVCDEQAGSEYWEGAYACARNIRARENT